MKTIAWTILAVTLVATPAFSAAGKALQSPQAGVLCDPYMCADANGVSKELTEKFLGKVAATRLFAQGTFDTSEFTFANGVFCDTKERACRQDRYFDANGQRSPVDDEATARLFGK
ncbi:YcgJ family protein [Ancylobacter sp. G4_0304]|uniref:YcgJ family protein n=1 Tax=Ancylobacter sp. G4_0304 TaxID=3114289 RepID=UPI0039C75C55